jgi:hypothetical protein
MVESFLIVFLDIEGIKYDYALILSTFFIYKTRKLDPKVFSRWVFYI